MRWSITFLSFLASIGVNGASTTAHACAGFACEPPTIVPRADRLPINASHVLVEGGLSLDETTVVVEELAGTDVVRTVDFDMLEVGKRYRVSASRVCDGAPPSEASPLEFEVGDAAPLPTSLGATVTIGSGVGTVPIAVSDGSCWNDFEVGYTDVKTDFAGVDPAVQAALVHHQVFVNGVRFGWALSYNGRYEDESGGDPLEGEAWRKPGAFRLWAWCPNLGDHDAGALPDGAYGLRPDDYEVYVEATIPDASRTVVRSTPTTVTLACPSEGPDAGTTDPTTPDAGQMSTDAGRPHDDGAIDQPVSDHAKSRCSVAHGSTSAGSAFLAMLVTAALVQRRRGAPHRRASKTQRRAR